MEKKAYLAGGKEITAYIPRNTSYTALENLYDCCNDLFSTDESCFYSKDEVKALKKDKNNIFLRGK